MKSPTKRAEQLEGLLWKQSPSKLRFGMHQRRHVVISDGRIAWSLPQTADKKEKGFLDFANNPCTVEPVEGSDVKFQIRPETGRWSASSFAGGTSSFTGAENGERVFAFDATDSGHSRDKWLNVIEAHIAFSKKGAKKQGVKKGLKFQDETEELDAASPESGSTNGRSVRGRVNTGFAFEKDEPEAKKNGCLKFKDDVEELDAASSASAGPKREVRGRVNTGFEREVKADEERRKPMQFSDDVEELEAASSASSGPKREVRGRVNTGFEREVLPDGEGRTPMQFGDVEELDAASESAGTGKRAVRGRVNTGFSRGGDANDSPDEGGGTQGIQFGDVEEVEAASFASSGPSRQVRARVNTGFAKEAMPDSDSDPDEPADLNARIAHRRSSRHSLRRSSLELAAAQKRRAQHEAIVQGRDGVLTEDSPEALIQSHLVEDGKKDEDMLKKALAPLALFDNIAGGSLQELVKSMQVFRYKDGELVVREDDGGGTYFFVVSDGVFEVIRGDNVVCEIQTGQTFGESVLLADGHRTASVRAKGAAEVCGLEADDVREVLRYEYEQAHKDVMTAVDKIIESGDCDQLSKMNAFQLHKLYIETQIKSYEDGTFIMKEHQGQLDEVWVLVHGAVVLRQAGRDVQRVHRFNMFGMRGLLFGDVPYSAAVDGSAKVLEISRRSLVEAFGATKMATVLIRSVVKDAMNDWEAMGKLHEDQRQQLCNAFNVMPLLPGQALDVTDIRFIMCLHNQVEVSTDGFKSDLRVLKEVDRGHAGMQQLLNRDLPWDLQVRADKDSTAFVAVWHTDEVDAILAKDETKERLRVLRTIFLFSTLSKPQLRKLATSMETENKEDGEAIVKEGEMGDTFYIIGSGRVGIEKNGRFIRGLQSGDYFGEIALLTQEPRSATITASGQCVIWKISHDTFQDAMPAPMVEYLKDRMQLLDKEYDFKDLEFVRLIGTGGFGVVKMVTTKSGHRYALKCVRKQPIVEIGQQEALVNERAVLAEIDHPFIIKLVQSFKNDGFVFFLLELVSGGELLEALPILGILDKSQAAFYTASILLAFQHLHDRRIAYLDLKSENVLIDHQGFVKIVDFGLAVKISGGKLHAVRGTPHFMSPEMILGKGYNTTADLWSLGICLYEFVVGELPFGKDCTTKSDIFKAVMKAPLIFPDFFKQQPWYEETSSLIRNLLEREPTRRIGSSIEGYDAILTHKFFHGYDWDALTARKTIPPYVPKKEHFTESSPEGAAKDIFAGKPGQNLAELEKMALKQELKSGWRDPAPGWDDDFT